VTQSARPSSQTIQAQKKSALVAQQLVDEIVERRLVAGDRLEAEAVMCDRFGVGRSTVREALRILENHGVVRIRTGPGGGPVVAPFDGGFLGSTMALHLQLTGATFRDVLDARLLLEPAIAAAAVENRDEEALATLRKIVDHGDDPTTDGGTLVHEAGDFHDAVAAGSGNAFFRSLLLALHEITEPFAQRLPWQGERRERLIHDHRRIVEAIENGDAAMASKVMRGDLMEFIGFAEEVAPDLLDEPITWGGSSR